MPTIDASVGGVASNSYETLAEANTYFDERLALSTPWVASGDEAIRSLLMATRVLESMTYPHKVLRINDCDCKYYYTAKTWTGAPATTAQRLAWPRTGMYDRNGNAIPSNVIPQELKDAESELAGQLRIADTTLDNAVIVGGIKSVSAGSVSVTFKDDIRAHVLPDSVLNLLPPSWFTAEKIELLPLALFDVL